MSHIYTPSAVKLVNITRPDDGDPRTAASVNVGTGKLADGIEYLNDRTELMFSTVTVVCTSSQTIQAPAGAYGAILEGCGGGAGGGGGAGRPSADYRNCGGGGGAGALRSMKRIDVVASADYAIVIGAGGSGGSGGSGAIGSAGSDGGDTTMTKVTGSVLVATFRGAGRGAYGNTETYGAGGGGIVAVYGGKPVRNNILPGLVISIASEDDSVLYPYAVNLDTHGPQGGGPGFSNNFVPAVEGGYSPEGYAGGQSGSFGTPTTSGSYQSGGCGGGGGAGPYGAGGAGGNGGAPNNGGAAGNGTVGGSASANSGAGGGGGGGGGGGASAGAGGTAGSGGSGQLTVTWLIAA